MSRSRDEHWMACALEAARQGVGLTRPNPPVGAVVVRHGRLAGSGFHAAAGAPHAEVLALREAGAGALDGTLYVTLEPCSTHGRTPPCTGAVLEAGIRRVVVSVRDPNPKHRGRGLRKLRDAGIAVDTGILAAEGERLIEPFAMVQRRHRPFVTLKMGMTLDGKIADGSGRSRWITGPDSRARVQELRRSADGILVGVETVCADDPSLTPRPARGRKPFRIVLDPDLRIPPGCKLLTGPFAARTLVCCARGAKDARVRRIRSAGAEVVFARKSRDGLDPASVLAGLGTRGLLHVVCEGGGRVAESLVRAGLADECWFFVAAKLLGGGGRDVFAGPGWKLKDAPALRILEVTGSGRDLFIRARPAGRGGA